MTLIIAAAVKDELSMLIRQIEKPVLSYVGQRESISGYMKGFHIITLITGPGIVNMVQALTAAIEAEKPALIIQTGSAGAFRESGLRIGDIGIATEEIYIHSGIAYENETSKLDPLPFPLLKHKGIEIRHQYSFDHDWVNSAFHIIKAGLNKKKIQVVKSPFITVSTITATDKRAKELFEQFGACMENMEGAGAAHLAIHYHLPFLEIRAASNMVGKRELSKWNLPLAFERCNLAVITLIQELSNFLR